jgi:hypothetical protein
MGTFADTANIAYHLLFVDEGKKTPIFWFLFAENKRKFAISVLRIYIETVASI